MTRRRHRGRQPPGARGARAASLDELPPQTRRLLALLDAMVAGECERQEMERQRLPLHAARGARARRAGATRSCACISSALVELEYLLVHRGGRGQSFVYELVCDGEGEDGAPFLSGWSTSAALRR